MGMTEAETFVVIFLHYYGKGGTIAEAVANAKAAGFRYPRGKRKAEALVYAIGCKPDQVEVSGAVGVRVNWPAGVPALQFDMEL